MQLACGISFDCLPLTEVLQRVAALYELKMRPWDLTGVSEGEFTPWLLVSIDNIPSFIHLKVARTAIVWVPVNICDILSS